MIKIFKKPAGSVRFRLYKPKTEKTEPNQIQTGKKPSQTSKKLSQTKKTELNWKKLSQTGLNSKIIFYENSNS
jgi:hypothetical protein